MVQHSVAEAVLPRSWLGKHLFQIPLVVSVEKPAVEVEGLVELVLDLLDSPAVQEKPVVRDVEESPAEEGGGGATVDSEEASGVRTTSSLLSVVRSRRS